jgi:hypothetical protein
MNARPRFAPSHATVVAYMALFIALGGTSYALTQLPPNSVGTAQLKPHSVGTAQLKDGAVGSNQLKRESVRVDKLAAASVGSAQIQGSAVTSYQIAPGAVGARQVEQGSLLYSDFATGEVPPRIFAHVNPDGTLGASGGVIGSGFSSNPGNYFITLQQTMDLSGCVAVASIDSGVLGAATASPGDTVQASLRGSSSPPEVLVSVFRGTTLDDAAFNIAVDC